MTTPVHPLPPNHARAEAALLGITFLWGSSFAAVDWALQSLGSWQLLAVRFTLAGLLALLWSPGALRVRGQGREWSASLWLSLWLGIGYVTQTFGLETTTPTRSAFITALLIVLVPVVQILRLRRRPRPGALVGIALATAGLWFLCHPSGGALVIGDWLTLICALAWSIYIVELQRLSGSVGLARLVLVQCLLIAALSWVMTLPSGAVSWDLGPLHWLVLIHLGVLCTFVTILVHNRFQRDTTPTRAALIFAAEPVFAALIAWVAFGHTLGFLGIVGAGLILAGILAAELR
jgi:drug/metabolite transporter (DMT)-like permease